jgi:hypothetical protein
MTPERKNETMIKMKEYNNKFFQERIDDKRKEIAQLENDIVRLQSKIDDNLIKIDEIIKNK